MYSLSLGCLGEREWGEKDCAVSLDSVNLALTEYMLHLPSPSSQLPPGCLKPEDTHRDKPYSDAFSRVWRCLEEIVNELGGGYLVSSVRAKTSCNSPRLLLINSR